MFFTDGSAEQIDIIVYCTGYRITFPFLDTTLVSSVDNEVSLFHRVVDPDHPGLYFIGPGAADRRGDAARRGAVAVGGRPARRHCRTAVEDRDAARDRAHHRKLEKRYVKSERHTIQVDFLDPTCASSKERTAGVARV